jgi:uncharacterized protein (DUF983 family)
MQVAEKRRSALLAMLFQRCPVCRRGQVFSGQFAMHERCPCCDLKFEREQGYFMGAMYVSYPLSVPILGLLIWIGYILLPSVRIEFVIGLALLAYLPFVPAVFRYSRVLWMFFDHWASPCH